MNVSEADVTRLLSQHYSADLDELGRDTETVMPYLRERGQSGRDVALHSITPRFQEIFKEIEKTLNEDVNLCILRMRLPVGEQFPQYEKVIRKVFNNTFKITIEESGLCKDWRSLSVLNQVYHGYNPPHIPNVETFVMLQGLAELKIHWKYQDREIIRDLLDLKNIPEVEKTKSLSCGPSSNAARESSPVATPSSPISDSKVSEEQVDRIFDAVATIRRELIDLRKTRSFLATEGGDLTHIQGDIAELNRKFASAVAALDEAMNPTVSKQQRLSEESVQKPAVKQSYLLSAEFRSDVEGALKALSGHPNFPAIRVLVETTCGRSFISRDEAVDHLNRIYQAIRELVKESELTNPLILHIGKKLSDMVEEGLV